MADPYKAIADGLILAFYIGQSHVVGGTTDMVAYANNNVFNEASKAAEIDGLIAAEKKAAEPQKQEAKAGMPKAISLLKIGAFTLW